MRIFKTEDINRIIEKINLGHKMSRKNNIFFRHQEGTLDDDISVLLSQDELIEYGKCANDICYFIESCCGVKLRQYQKEWIDNFMNNRFMIYCTSRQTGYSAVMAAVYLHYMIFNKNKTILVVSNKCASAVEFMHKLFKHYQRIPYWIKPGIVTKNNKNLKFNNGNQIRMRSGIKSKPTEFSIDLLSYMEFSHIPQSTPDMQYNNTLVPELCANTESKICIQSQPAGFDSFYQLINDSERKPNDPMKNIYKTVKTYWWEVDGRDDTWRQREINIIGADAFAREYDLQFVSKAVVQTTIKI